MGWVVFWFFRASRRVLPFLVLLFMKNIISAVIWERKRYWNIHHSRIESWWAAHNRGAEPFPIHGALHPIPLQSNNTNERPGVCCAILSETHSPGASRVVRTWSMRSSHVMERGAPGWYFNMYCVTGVKGRVRDFWHKWIIPEVREDWLLVRSRNDLQTA